MPAKFLKSVTSAADIPKSGKPQIALVGRSNVGKSSLINHLAGAKELARTSARPGLTQTLNLYDFDGRYLLVDLPGYGYSAADPSQAQHFAGMIGDYLSEAEQLKLVLLIVDARIGLTDSDRHAFAQLREEKIPFVVVLNKVDKLSNAVVIQALRPLRAVNPEISFLTHSTSSSKGLGEIRDVIERAVRAAATK